jgi:hypothetical protein
MTSSNFEPIVLAELIKLAKRSKHVIQISVSKLVDSLHTNQLIFIQSVKKLQKDAFLEAIFDGDNLYFKLTGLCFEDVSGVKL